ncbi:MAG: polysaccharide biosynthesis protein [Lachnospiraceae bacterium]|nr:polysaccharide biosynthesis protein [Lachnospiraceae bacterium]
MSRVNKASKNIMFGYLGIIITGPLGMVLRSVFIHHLGDTLTGVNDLYTIILSVLSMAELGIGTALTFSLYAPVAHQRTEKIKSYMRLYKKAYITIGIVVAVIGTAISPFLPYLVNVPEGVADISVRDLTLYYFIFLFNTVSTYFVAYKFSLVNAEQKNYIHSNIITITRIITVVIQLLVIVITKNFYWYLLSAAFVELTQKIFANYYLNRMYPYLKEKNVEKLTKEETQVIITKTKALVLTKVGDVMRIQTGGMIVSAFINVRLLAFIGSYNMIIDFVSRFVDIIFNNVISSFGNLIATETKEKQFLLFRVYRFFACWIYGFFAVVFFVLLSPFISIWLGAERVLSVTVVALMVTDFYFKGDRVVLFNFKTAAGVFEPDRYLPLIQGILNVVIALSLVKHLGLVGVFIGTLVSGLLANFIRPRIIYRICFERKASGFYIDWFKYLIVTAGLLMICLFIGGFILSKLNILTFILMGLIITLIFNGIFILLFRRSEEFCYLWELIKSWFYERRKIDD